MIPGGQGGGSGELNGMYGKTGPEASFYGKKHTPETLKRMSEVKKGKKNSEEHKRNMSKARMGVGQAEETKKKISETLLKEGVHGLRGVTGEDHPLYKRPRPSEVRNKIGKANKGKTRSEETKKRLSDAKRASRMECENCGRIIPSNVYSRCHGEKCKFERVDNSG